MKTFLLLSLILLCAVTLNAQTQAKPAFLFMSLGAGVGTHAVGNVSLDMIVPANNLSFTLGHHFQTRNAPNVPSDYYGGIFSGMFNNDDQPDISASSFYFTGGKMIPTQRRGCRFILSGGVGMVRVKRPVNFQSYEPSGFIDAIFGSIIGGNYTYDMEKETTVGLILNPRIDFPFSRYFGVSVGTMANLNKVDSSVGLNMSLHMGLLRGRQGR